MLNTQKAAVIGHPIGHTMSPFIQKRLFELAGILMEYQVIDVPDLESDLDTLCSLDCFNVTIPHKSAIIPFLSGISERAERSGSVNTVTVRDGKLYGDTSDGPGASVALSIHGEKIKDREILLLGNGGAAKAIAFVAAEHPNFHITIAHRAGSIDKAAALAYRLKEFAAERGDNDSFAKLISYDELENQSELGATHYDLLINATSVGMYPNTGISPVSKSVVSACDTVFDIVYNPKKTELLSLAEEVGATAIGGMGMLVCQAAYSHHIWYGTEFKNEDLLKLIDDAEKELEMRFGGKGGNK